MNDDLTPEGLAALKAAHIDPAVSELRPDYRVWLLVAEGLKADFETGDLLTRAEAHARDLLADSAIEDLRHIAAWREAFRSFGAKPQRTRNSLEALTRRAPDGLPRINALTDAYNAISVLHQVPIGGENLDAYQGPARLVRATGDEPFDTMAGGEPAIEHPKPGEVVWRDDAGVTCRIWNWRQCTRTQLRDNTGRALFILDALEPMDDAALMAAGEHLQTVLREGSPGATTGWRLLR
jgi:DNA/RNA-binding domain of Phe-tRNA-synthetase-like protein